ncbi:hypothetical protein KV557_24695 [Kitasatospora aureofaciens]|uniref:hypothetical protein n=1 Tax=Kitasatospora aureofaciens TaxID=1894 RepID=UPI001C46E4E5|nr:hypothetical protein [Kitasatospora aureofaciens]MBV6700264.1 hypothetical protein [Kitasatospora aureofaciens]
MPKFQAKQAVRIVACADNPKVVGEIGYIVDEAEPGPLTDYRWTVRFGRFFTGPVLCSSDELAPADS